MPREEPLLAAEVERERRPAEDRGNEAGVAGETAGLGGGDEVAGVEAGRPSWPRRVSRSRVTTTVAATLP